MEQKWQHHHQNHQKKEKFKCHIAYDLDIWFFQFQLLCLNDVSNPKWSFAKNEMSENEERRKN